MSKIVYGSYQNLFDVCILNTCFPSSFISINLEKNCQIIIILIIQRRKR